MTIKNDPKGLDRNYIVLVLLGLKISGLKVVTLSKL